MIRNYEYKTTQINAQGINHNQNNALHLTYNVFSILITHLNDTLDTPNIAETKSFKLLISVTEYNIW